MKREMVKAARTLNMTMLRMNSLVSDVGLTIRGRGPEWFACTVYDATYKIMPGACKNQLRCKKCTIPSRQMRMYWMIYHMSHGYRYIVIHLLLRHPLPSSQFCDGPTEDDNVAPSPNMMTEGGDAKGSKCIAMYPYPWLIWHILQYILI